MLYYPWGVVRLSKSTAEDRRKFLLTSNINVCFWRGYREFLRHRGQLLAARMGVRSLWQLEDFIKLERTCCRAHSCLTLGEEMYCAVLLLSTKFLYALWSIHNSAAMHNWRTIKPHSLKFLWWARDGICLVCAFVSPFSIVHWSSGDHSLISQELLGAVTNTLISSNWWAGLVLY